MSSKTRNGKNGSVVQADKQYTEEVREQALENERLIVAKVARRFSEAIELDLGCDRLPWSTVDEVIEDATQRHKIEHTLNGCFIHVVERPQNHIVVLQRGSEYSEVLLMKSGVVRTILDELEDKGFTSVEMASGEL